MTVTPAASMTADPASFHYQVFDTRTGQQIEIPQPNEGFLYVMTRLHLSIDIPDRAVSAFIGPSGCGKSTAGRSILRLVEPTAGSIEFDGRDITRMATPDIARLGIAYVPESMAIFADLTVQENLVLAARSGPPDAARLDWIFGRFEALKRFWTLPAGNLSGGQKQMLSISRAVVEPRKLVVIDEPTKGLAPAIINNLIEALLELKKSGTTILMVEHNMNVVSSIADTISVLQRGQVIAEGPYAQVSTNPQVLEGFTPAGEPVTYQPPQRCSIGVR